MSDLKPTKIPGIAFNQATGSFHVFKKVDGKQYRRRFDSLKEAEKYLASITSQKKRLGELEGLNPEETMDWKLAREELNKVRPDLKVADAVRQFCAREKLIKRHVPLREAVEAFLKNREEVKARSRRHLRNLKDRLGCLCDEYAGKNVSELNSAGVLEWVQGQYSNAKTVKNWVGDIQAFMNYCSAKDRAWCEPFEFDRDSMANPASPVRAILAPLEVKALLTKLHYDSRKNGLKKYFPFVFIQAFAGVREAEARRFCWEWVDFKEKVIRVPEFTQKKEKTQKTGGIWTMRDLPEGFFEALKPYASIGQFKSPSYSVYWELRRGLVAAELVKGVVKSNGTVDFPHNGLRHSFATYSIAYHGDAARVAGLTRHSNQHTLMKHYVNDRLKKEDGETYFKVIKDFIPA